jgi:MSHA biogenesis protein MshL
MQHFRVWSVLTALLAGCATPVLPPSPTHIVADGPVPAGSIPAPVQIPSALPRPRPVQKPETYSVVVNNVKVHELLFSLARDAKLNVDIHPGINGAVTLNAVEQTLPQLLSRIAKQVDMRWELDGPNLVVMPDSPFLRLYRIDYLNMERMSTSTVGVSSQISAGGTGSGGGGGGGAGGNTSSTILRNVSDNKFWETLIKNVEELLRETDRILPAGAAAPAPPPPASAQGAQPGQQQAPAAPQPAAPSATYREAASVIANKEAGVISIRATSRQHEKIQEFLDHVMVSAKRQVLIEATIVEVQLNNAYQQGIDWSLLSRGRVLVDGQDLSRGITGGQNVLGNSLPAGARARPPVTTGLAIPGMFTAGIANPNLNIGNLSATIRLLESFGTTRVLSSPKLSILNNQTAVLKVVDEVVYFTVQASQSASGTAGTVLTTFNTTAQTTPIGFVMNVTPQIGESDVIILNLRPSLTRINRFVPDPNPSLGAVQNLIPEVQRREMESLIKVNSGQIAVMGGLIQDSVVGSDAGIPGLSQSSAGVLFSQRALANTKTELVVFLRPLVIKDPSVDGDFRSFRAYMPDDMFLSRPNPAKPLSGGSELR